MGIAAEVIDPHQGSASHSHITGSRLDRHRRVAGILDGFRQFLGVGRSRLHLRPLSGEFDLRTLASLSVAFSALVSVPW